MLVSCNYIYRLLPNVYANYVLGLVAKVSPAELRPTLLVVAQRFLVATTHTLSKPLIFCFKNILSRAQIISLRVYVRGYYSNFKNIF